MTSLYSSPGSSLLVLSIACAVSVSLIADERWSITETSLLWPAPIKNRRLRGQAAVVHSSESNTRGRKQQENPEDG